MFPATLCLKWLKEEWELKNKSPQERSRGITKIEDDAISEVDDYWQKCA